MVTKQDGIPLYHHTVPGNQHDSKEFPVALSAMMNRFEKLGIPPGEITLVFDRGFNSNRNFRLIVEKSFGFVAALRIGDITDSLFQIPLRRFNKIKDGDLKDLRHFKTTCSIDGIEYAAILYTSKILRDKQIRDLDKNLAERIKKLEDWQTQIADHVSMTHHYDQKIVQRRIDRLLTGNFIKEILSIEYDLTKPEQERLKFSVDYKAKAKIVYENFGKRVLITNRDSWTPAQVIRTYFSLATVEHAFRACKDHHHIRMRPQFHWTDHNIEVHAFTCFLALLLGKLLFRKASKIVLLPSMQSLIEKLNAIRIASLLSPELSCSWKIEHMEALSRKLFTALVPN